jgi:type IV secretory pathway TraG/TraD family ATPase VirD4
MTARPATMSAQAGRRTGSRRRARSGPMSGPTSGPGRRPGALVLIVSASAALGANLVVAGGVSAALFGRGWSWPPSDRLLAAALGAVLHPSSPGQGWPAPTAARMAGAASFWAVFAALAVIVVLAALLVAAISGCRPRSFAPRSLGPRSFGPRNRRRRRLRGWPAPARRARGAPGRSRPTLAGRPARGLPAMPSGPPLRDRRDRYGFAGRQELRREASVTAARRRAAQTRPSLVAVGKPLPRSEVGYPLGRSARGGVLLWPSWEASLRLVAPPGEGKTFRALAPILRQHPGPALATSTKADLFELTMVARSRRGPVVALDPDGVIPGAQRARWSPVSGCERSEVAERRAGALVAATSDDGDAQNGAFFRDSARDLLKAYLHAAALEDLDLRAVLGWSRRPEDPTPAEVLLSSPWAAPGWGDLIALHTTGAAETTSGVMRYVARALSCFSHQDVVDACCPAAGEELDIAQFLRDNGTIYLAGKGARLGAVAPLLTAFADEVFDCAERLAAQAPNRRLDPPLLGLLDEAPSIAPLPSLPDLLADGRGRGIVMVYAMQSFSQAVTRWGAQKAETMGNSTTITVVLGGITSPTDLADLERTCGQRRVKRESTHSGSRGQHGAERSRTVSWESEAVLRADQVRTLPSGVALVLWSKLPPVLARLELLSDHPDWPQIRDEEATARQANDLARAGA